jgi:hypothetical protein
VQFEHVDSFSHLDPDPSARTIDQMPLDQHITHHENLAHLDQVVNTRFTFAGSRSISAARTAARPARWPWPARPHQFWMEAAKIPAMSSSVTGRAHVASRRCCFIVPGTRSPMSASV